MKNSLKTTSITTEQWAKAMDAQWEKHSTPATSKAEDTKMTAALYSFLAGVVLAGIVIALCFY